MKRIAILVVILISLMACAGESLTKREQSSDTDDAIGVSIDFDRSSREATITLKNLSDRAIDYYDGYPETLWVRIRDEDGVILSSREADEGGFITSAALSSQMLETPVPLTQLGPRSTVSIRVPLERLLLGMERYTGLARPPGRGEDLQFRCTVCIDSLLTECIIVESEWFSL